MSDATPEEQLEEFIGRFTPEIAGVGRAAVERMRVRLPGAIRMVYDNYNALVVGFCPNERPSDAIFSIAIYPRSVGLCFLQGVGLPDPQGLLRGSGNQVRHVPLSSAEDIDRPAVRALMDAALERARVPLDPSAPGRLVIRSISARQRPRRPAK